MAGPSVVGPEVSRAGGRGLCRSEVEGTTVSPRWSVEKAEEGLGGKGRDGRGWRRPNLVPGRGLASSPRHVPFSPNRVSFTHPERRK